MNSGGVPEGRKGARYRSAAFGFGGPALGEKRRPFLSVWTGVKYSGQFREEILGKCFSDPCAFLDSQCLPNVPVDLPLPPFFREVFHCIEVYRNLAANPVVVRWFAFVAPVTWTWEISVPQIFFKGHPFRFLPAVSALGIDSRSA